MYWTIGGVHDHEDTKIKQNNYIQRKENKYNNLKLVIRDLIGMALRNNLKQIKQLNLRIHKIR